MVVDEFRKISPHLIENEEMKKHTTFKIGGTADMFVSVKTADELADLIRLAKATDTPFFVMGNGSNILVSDNGIRGLVIEIGKNMSKCSVEGNVITAEAGALMSKIASLALDKSLMGFEEISGIPGTLGGAIYMNAGAYGGEIKAIADTVKYVDSNGDFFEISGEECGFGYRTSIFAEGDKFVVSAKLRLQKGNSDEIREKMAEYTRRRREKQPLQYPSAGSTFKRPEGYFAGGLIEDAGLKGFTVGGAKVSELHAGFVINIGNATANDVKNLIAQVQKKVKDKFNVELEPEVKFIGE